MSERPTTTIGLEQEIALLERNLNVQLEAHRQLLACIERNREAVRRADMEQIRSVCEQENGVVQRLAELEKSRLVLVGRLTERLQPDAPRPLSLTGIAEAVGGPGGTRLSTLAAQLRAAIDEVGRASSVVRAAADVLARHMTGLMQTVQSAFGRAKVYGRRGRLVTGDQNQYCVDVRS